MHVTRREGIFLVNRPVYASVAHVDAPRGGIALAISPLKTPPRARKAPVPAITAITAEYWHFAALKVPLQAPQRKVLERILTYGAAPAEVSETGRLLLVVPRLGTISPWASKATDIAHSCGLESVERIERGVAYYVGTKKGAPLDKFQQAALLPLIHDRMTETVLDTLEA